MSIEILLYIIIGINIVGFFIIYSYVCDLQSYFYSITNQINDLKKEIK